jgi:hypothetical protein
VVIVALTADKDSLVEQQAVGVPTEMAEFYKVFCVNYEGTLLPTMMPVGILDNIESIRPSDLTTTLPTDRGWICPCWVNWVP